MSNIDLSQLVTAQTRAAAALEALKRSFISAVATYMDKAAQERRYDGILSLCTYATSTDATFAAEGQAGVDFRDTCWRHCYDVLEQVEAGTRAAPSVDELVAELPTLTWPPEPAADPAQDAGQANQVDESETATS